MRLGTVIAKLYVVIRHQDSTEPVLGSTNRTLVTLSRDWAFCRLLCTEPTADKWIWKRLPRPPSGLDELRSRLLSPNSLKPLMPTVANESRGFRNFQLHSLVCQRRLSFRFSVLRQSKRHYMLDTGSLDLGCKPWQLVWRCMVFTVTWKGATENVGVVNWTDLKRRHSRKRRGWKTHRTGKRGISMQCMGSL